MSRPLISIIVAVFNGANTLQQCIDSVAAQTYPARELIVIDGGSTDGTVALLENNRAKITRWISEPDRGIYCAMNKGLALAQGGWLCFLGADDYLWDAGVLDRVATELDKLPPDIRVAYGQVMLLNAAGENLYALGDPWPVAKKRFGAFMSIPHQGVMHHRSLFAEHGNFDDSYRIAGDYELLLRELKCADAAFLPGLIITGMRHGGVSSAPANALVAMREFRRAQRKQGRRWPGPAWLWATAKVIMRMLLWKTLGEARAKRAIDSVRRLKGAPPYWSKL